MDPMVQPNPFKTAVDAMLILQSYDDQIRQLKRKAEELQENVDASKAVVETAKAQQEQLKASFDQEKKKRGLYELEVKVKEEDILKHNGQLADCKSNEAYSTKLNEIKTAKDSKREMEEKIIQLMENEESIHKQFEEQAKELEAKTAEAQTKQKAAETEAGGLEGEGNGLKAKRDEILGKLDEQHRELYLRRVAKRPKVITLVTETLVCSACSMKVPAHQINELKKLKNFIHCQSCGVILVIPDPA